MYEMISIPSFLGFLMPLPALLSKDGGNRTAPQRRRAVHALRLSPHILKDVGLDEFEGLAPDPRWVQRPDLER